MSVILFLTCASLFVLWVTPYSCTNEKASPADLDAIAYDRVTMQRVRRVLDSAKPGALVDVHQGTRPANGSCNGYPTSGDSPALNYMQHLPSINRVWFGEGFDYQSTSPDYFLIEASGIAFGVLGDMNGEVGKCPNPNPW
eukprot:SAG22_NODE_714_length_7722_cov_3.919585_6_plen_140_part_00